MAPAEKFSRPFQSTRIPTIANAIFDLLVQKTLDKKQKKGVKMPCEDLATKVQLDELKDFITEKFALIRTEIYDAQNLIDNNNASRFNDLYLNLETPFARINKIYKILGGDNWFEASPYNPNLDIDYETRIKEHKAQIYTISENGESFTPKESATEGLPQFISRCIATVFHRLGLDNYPIKVPQNVTLDIDKDNDGNATESNYIKVESGVLFSRWQFQQLDALFGRFPIKIKIEDNDLIKAGDQGTEIRLPNLAETVAELTGKLLMMDAKINSLMNIGLRSLAENGSSKLTTIKTYHIVDCIAEYLNYSDTQKKIKVPFTFDPKVLAQEAEDGEITQIDAKLADFLQMTEIEIEVEEIKDKDTLTADLTPFLEAARIIKAVYFQPIKGNSVEELKNSIKEDLKGLVDLFDGYAASNNSGVPSPDGDPNSPKNRKEQDFDVFLEKAERGFLEDINVGEEEATKPYGKPYAKRPKIRKIGKQGEVK
jgi:hypothetical protein